MNTLATLIATADNFDSDTAWLLKHLKRNIPENAEILNADAEVLADPIPEFRPKKAGGLIKIGDHIIGNAKGAGFFDGVKGHWPEMKHDIFNALFGSVKPMKKVAATKAKKENKNEVAAAKNVEEDAPEYEDFLICEKCGKKVSYEEGLVRVGGKRICGKCAHGLRAKVNVPNPDATDAE